MTDEQLEEIREYFDGYGSRHDEAILKLVEQAKRAKRDERDFSRLYKSWQKMKQKEFSLAAENERYRATINAMGQIFKDAIYSLDVGEKVQGLEYGVAMRDEALEEPQ